MENNCKFQMYVKGNPDNIRSLYSAMVKIRGFHVGLGPIVEAKFISPNEARISGVCKESVKFEFVSKMEEKQKNGCAEYLTLWEACKKWSLDIEVTSQTVHGFKEHYMCSKGELICNSHEQITE